MSMTTSTQAAAEYVALIGRNAATTVQGFGQNALRFVETNPTVVVIGVAAFIVLIWLTRARTR